MITKLDQYIEKTNKTNIEKQLHKIEEIKEIYSGYTVAKKELLQNANTKTEQEITQDIENMILTLTCIPTNFMRYYYLYELFKNTTYEEEFYYNCSDFIQDKNTMQNICTFIENLTFKDRKALLLNAEVYNKKVKVNPYIAPEFIWIKEKIEKIQSLTPLKRMINQFKEEFQKPEHSYPKMDKIRLKIDQYAKEQKNKGIWTQQEVNKVTNIGFYYHRNDVEYNYYNKQTLLKLFDEILDTTINII